MDDEQTSAPREDRRFARDRLLRHVITVDRLDPARLTEAERLVAALGRDLLAAIRAAPGCPDRTNAASLRGPRRVA